MVWGTLDTTGSRRYDLHPGQADILRHPARFKAAIAGTGGGKTAIGPLWVMQQINRCLSERDVSADPIKGLILAPTYPVMARATAPTLTGMFAGTDLEGRYVPTQSRYYLPRNMGEIWLLGADRSEGIEGGQFDFCWGDEAGQFKLSVWIAIQGRLGLKQAPCLLTTTPYSLNWLKRKFLDYFLRGDPDYYARMWSSKDNPAYPEEEYERAKRTMSKERFAMRYDGQFTKAEGLVLPDFDSVIVPHEDPPEGKDVGGLDFGWEDPFVALAGTSYFDEGIDDDVLYVWYERYKRHELLGQHARAIPTGVRYFADSSRPDSIRELRRAGHYVQPDKSRRIDIGIEAVNARIYSGRLKVSERCKALIWEAQNLQYKMAKDEESFQDKPEEGNDHAVDALRYLVYGHDRRRIIKNQERQVEYAA